MKKIIISSCAILFTIIGYAQSQDQIAMIQGLWGQEKRELIGNVIKLSPEEETVFWEQYDAYEISRKELGKERLDILTQYAENYDSLTDEMVSDLIYRGIANNKDLDNLLKKTFKKMSKSVAPLQAALFVQLENYFMIEIQTEIQENIFFIGELDALMDDD